MQEGIDVKSKKRIKNGEVDEEEHIRLKRYLFYKCWPDDAKKREWWVENFGDGWVELYGWDIDKIVKGFKMFRFKKYFKIKKTKNYYNDPETQYDWKGNGLWEKYIYDHETGIRTYKGIVTGERHGPHELGAVSVCTKEQD